VIRRIAPTTLFCALVCLCSTLPAQTVPAEYVQNLKKGVELHLAQEYEEALTYLARARRIYPQDWRGHTWQALTLINMASGEKDLRRRDALIDEAKAMQSPLLKQAGMLFQSPLRMYLNGLANSTRGDAAGAYREFRKAFLAKPELFKKYESIELRKHVKNGYALASLDLGVSVIIQAQYEDALRFLAQADQHLGANHTHRLVLHSNHALVCEALGQFELALKHIHRCIEICEKSGEKDKAIGYRASTAMIHLQKKDVDKARKILDALPKDSVLQRVIQARCRLRLIETERDPSKLLETLAFFRKQLKHYPEDGRMRLIVDYGELVVTYMGRRQADENRDLILKMIEMVEKERKLHPECPALYWILSKSHRLLGDMEKALTFERLHEQKRKEYETKHRFDSKGRNRCAGS
jgi:tetratricopeptide (TPR) repeat protein